MAKNEIQKNAFDARRHVYNPREFRRERVSEPAYSSKSTEGRAGNGRGARIVLSGLLLLVIFAVLKGGYLNQWLPGATAEPLTTANVGGVPKTIPLATLRIESKDHFYAAFARVHGPVGEQVAYVRPGETARLKLPGGEYRVEIIAGAHWYNVSVPFGLGGVSLPVTGPVRLVANLAVQTEATITIPEQSQSAWLAGAK
jgi:hypothetical protein